jgi:hypothetical protein
MAETIRYDDFAAPDLFAGGRWEKQRLPQYDMWDDTTVVTCADNTLTLDATPFRLHRRNFHDHVKAIFYSTRHFAPGERGEIAIEVEMAVTTSGTAANPYGADPDDVRLAAGAFNIIDHPSAMVFDFFVSNGRVVALYERLPFALSEANRYPLFTELIATDVATAPGAWHRYAIAYDAGADRVEWRVDDVMVAERTPVGAPPGEAGPIVKLGGLQIGGGLFTLLDDLHDDRRETGDGTPVAGLDPTYARTVFGQGARASFRNFTVTRR